MEFVKLTPDNLEQEHICCAISNNKDLQVQSKKTWLRERLDEGLVFLKGDVRGKCFIEYLPAEYAWAPVEADGYLVHPQRDTRMALALVIRIAPPICDQIEAFLDELKRLEPELYYYPAKDLHITVMDILRGIPDRPVPDNIDDYIRCIEACAGTIPPFRTAFDGLTMSDNAVMVKGYYEPALEALRRRLRRAMREQGLLLEERYETFSAHVTAARIPGRLTAPEPFLSQIADRRPFGEMEVSSFELVFHNWYDSKKKLLARIPAGS